MSESNVASPHIQLEHVEASEIATSLSHRNDRHFVESSSPNIDVTAPNVGVNDIRHRSHVSRNPRRQQNRINLFTGELVTNSSTNTQGFRPFIGILQDQPTVYV
ncbi:unnamed protein product [Lymnaea stagnalis]|uniref:Uncharacterized protein n=1 Tax=Lymnaea stagnalis TaxID=6523 RepID=A0AAV2IM89_LYMST